MTQNHENLIEIAYLERVIQYFEGLKSPWIWDINDMALRKSPLSDDFTILE